jgi:hypothetical protein
MILLAEGTALNFFSSEERSCDATPWIAFSSRAQSDESMSHHL